MWLPCEDTGVAYCAARLPLPKGSKAPKTAAKPSGCRRPFGEGLGFCNWKTQENCRRSTTCECGRGGISNEIGMCTCDVTKWAEGLVEPVID